MTHLNFTGQHSKACLFPSPAFGCSPGHPLDLPTRLYGLPRVTVATSLSFSTTLDIFYIQQVLSVVEYWLSQII